MKRKDNFRIYIILACLFAIWALIIIVNEYGIFVITPDSRLHVLSVALPQCIGFAVFSLLAIWEESK